MKDQIGFVEDTRPPKGAWAPGGYYCTCRTCHNKFIGDKRATSCAPCAYAEQPKELDPVQSDIQQHLKQYREAERAIIDHVQATMPFGTIVRVDCQGRFRGLGKSVGPAESGVDHVAVLLENGNTWHYPVERVRPITEEEKNNLPKWLQ